MLGGMFAIHPTGTVTAAAAAVPCASTSGTLTVSVVSCWALNCPGWNHFFSRMAPRTTTIEYMPTECVPSAGARDSPCSRMRIIHPKLAASEYLAAVSGEETNRRDSNSTAQWDFAFTYSSYEHDGLGRYGDPLNPSGDIESVQKVRCQLKPGGLLFIGVPTARRDLLVWNAHRIYGPKRLPLLSANFEVLDVLGHAPSGTTDATRLHRYEKRGRWMFQHIIVLRKPLVEKFRKGKHAAV